MDSNVGALKNEIAQLRRLVADLRVELGEVLMRQNDLERSFEERLDCHREDLDWDREECILLRTGLWENEDKIAELSIQGQQMARSPFSYFFFNSIGKNGVTKYLSRWFLHCCTMVVQPIGVG